MILAFAPDGQLVEIGDYFRISDFLYIDYILNRSTKFTFRETRFPNIGETNLIHLAGGFHQLLIVASGHGSGSKSDYYLLLTFFFTSSRKQKRIPAIKLKYPLPVYLGPTRFELPTWLTSRDSSGDVNGVIHFLRIGSDTYCPNLLPENITNSSAGVSPSPHANQVYFPPEHRLIVCTDHSWLIILHGFPSRQFHCPPAQR